MKHTLKKGELAPGLNESQVAALKSDIAEKLKSYVGRALDEHTKSSMQRAIQGVLHKHRRSISAPVPEWLTVRLTEKDGSPVIVVTGDWERLPKSLDREELQKALGLTKWD